MRAFFIFLSINLHFTAFFSCVQKNLNDNDVRVYQKIKKSQSLNINKILEISNINYRLKLMMKKTFHRHRQFAAQTNELKREEKKEMRNFIFTSM